MVYLDTQSVGVADVAVLVADGNETKQLLYCSRQGASSELSPELRHVSYETLQEFCKGQSNRFNISVCVESLPCIAHYQLRKCCLRRHRSRKWYTWTRNP